MTLASRNGVAQMQDAERFVEGAEGLKAAFGRWPSFHDAEVVSIVLDRGGLSGPALEAKIHVFLMTDQVDEHGRYILSNHTLVTLRFRNIVLMRLAFFNSQNVLADLDLTPVDPDASEGRVLAASFSASWGVEAELLCDSVAVMRVEPFLSES
jgi:hypothetical protein